MNSSKRLLTNRFRRSVRRSARHRATIARQRQHRDCHQVEFITIGRRTCSPAYAHPHHWWRAYNHTRHARVKAPRVELVGIGWKMHTAAIRIIGLLADETMALDLVRSTRSTGSRRRARCWIMRRGGRSGNRARKARKAPNQRRIGGAQRALGRDEALQPSSRSRISERCSGLGVK